MIIHNSLHIIYMDSKYEIQNIEIMTSLSSLSMSFTNSFSFPEFSKKKNYQSFWDRLKQRKKSQLWRHVLTLYIKLFLVI